MGLPWRASPEDILIVSLPTGVGKWHVLTDAALIGCDELLSLPGAVKGWSRLERLKVCCKKLTQLPDGVGSWRHLRKLTFKTGRSAASLPATSGHGWSSLERLDLENLASLPATAGGWTKLESLRITSLHLKELPGEAVGMWTVLDELHLRCPKLLELPDTVAAWKKLRSLQLSCPKMERLPEAANSWTNLQGLYLKDPCTGFIKGLTEDIRSRTAYW